MKILYGVQGTGNGHTSRARAMAKHFAHVGADVTYLFSGRARDKYFEMECFGNFSCYQGLSFHITAGKVNYTKTIMTNNIGKFAADVIKLDLDEYDLIISDFEPITAWAGKLRGKPVIAIGHQPAFLLDIPKVGRSWLSRLVMRYFAPANINIGLHWHHFDQLILPPIIHLDENKIVAVEQNKVVVYLPFEALDQLKKIICEFKNHEFYVYHPDNKCASDDGHLHFRPLSVQGFQADLHNAPSVICNAGFELASECLHLGKKLLVKPVKGQMEQLSNAKALDQLGLAYTVAELNCNDIERWLSAQALVGCQNYPDVAEAIAEWVLAGGWNDLAVLKRRLWRDFNGVDCSEPALGLY